LAATSTRLFAISAPERFAAVMANGRAVGNLTAARESPPA